jgi:hypothetical protein
MISYLENGDFVHERHQKHEPTKKNAKHKPVTGVGDSLY